MKLKKLLLAGGAAAIVTASTAYASILDRPFFQVLGVVIVWGADGMDGTSPVASDFVLLTPASGSAGVDLIGANGATVITGTLDAIDADGINPGATAANPVDNAFAIINELHQYSPKLAEKPRWLVFNKIDLLPYLEFEVAKCIEYARRVNPDIQVLQVSATSGEGLEDWYEWIKTTRQTRLIGRSDILSKENNLQKLVSV